jgi:hypothetical protein
MVKLAAGLAVGSGVMAGELAASQEPTKAVDTPEVVPAKDALLAMAIDNPQGFMLTGAKTFRLEGDGASRDLLITSALDRDGKRNVVRVPSGSMRIFRADADIDEFTRQGSLHWRFHDTQGRVKLKTPGEIVMLVREGYATVRCYIMTPDERC